MSRLQMAGLIIDNHCLGDDMLLTKVMPYYSYVDNKKTDSILGYKYAVILPKHGFETLYVKIEGPKPLVKIPSDAAYVAVTFSNLQVKLYYDSNHNLQVTAKATDISIKTSQDGNIL